MEAEVEVHVRTELPVVEVELRATLEGLRGEQVRPEGTTSVRLTVPVNPFPPVTVTVELADEPALGVPGDELDTAKSVITLTLTVVV